MCTVRYGVQQVPVPSARYYKLRDFSFNDLPLTDDDTLRACLRMFLDLHLVERFNIDYQTLCRWLLSVKKNYRSVAFLVVECTVQ